MMAVEQEDRRSVLEVLFLSAKRVLTTFGRFIGQKRWLSCVAYAQIMSRKCEHRLQDEHVDLILMPLEKVAIQCS